MKRFSRNKLTVLIGLAFASNISYAEPPAPIQEGSGTGSATPPSVVVLPQTSPPNTEDASVAAWQGLIMPKIGYFNTFGGMGPGFNNYLQRYDYRQSSFGDNPIEGLLVGIDFSLLYAR